VTEIAVTRLLEGVGARPVGPADVVVSGVAYRSGSVVAGDAFFCVNGFKHDGHDYAADAVSRGAAALVVGRELPGIECPQFVVPDTRVALALGAAVFHGDPSASLEVIGLTGTNGKTTTSYLVDAILRHAGRKTGVIGTVETRVGDERLHADRTTPESSDLQALLARMRDEGVSAVSMEVSSHAIDLHRVDGVRFAVAAFTNLTQDHLDYHHTLEEYFSVKRRLFTDFNVGARVVNIDDPLGEDIAREVDGVLTVGRSATAAVRAENEELSAAGAVFTLVAPQGARVVHLPLAGGFNVSNALVAAGCCLALGIELDTVVAGLEHAPQVPGRLERVDCGQEFAVVVDYAHTPDSLEKATRAVRAVTAGRVIVVFGCGGDRDPEKRPLMGRAAGQDADIAIITSDNPRSEDPVGIILQVEDGIKGMPATYEVEVDRRRAIGRAISLARPGDCVLIAGKGHEDYQIFADRTVHFDDREVAREELAGRC
jgi:UDP-N-acetylmuramoyl-L-alanyl-D-glutamate--2,6-diaminopimelate ligase